MEKGTVNIHGKEYQTVAFRISKFREKYKIEEGWSIQTEIITCDNNGVVIKASIIHKDCTLATGFAEENRKYGSVNRTSALENCETSAIGRALASAGFLGTEFACSEEMAKVAQYVEQEKQKQPTKQQKQQSAKQQQAQKKQPSIPLPNLDEKKWYRRFVPKTLLPYEWRDKALTWECMAIREDDSLKTPKKNGKGVWTPPAWIHWRADEEENEALRKVWQACLKLRKETQKQLQPQQDIGANGNGKKPPQVEKDTKQQQQGKATSENNGEKPGQGEMFELQPTTTQVECGER